MKNLRRFILNLSAAAVIAVSATAICSCNSDSGYDPNESGVIALVTYNGTTQSTGSGGQPNFVTTFTYYGLNDSEVSTLYAQSPTNMYPSTLHEGDRVVLTYQPQDYTRPTQSGAITVVRLLELPTTEVQIVSSEAAQADNAGINLVFAPASLGNGQTVMQPALTRTGPYINIEAFMPYVADRKFILKADESTLNSSRPVLYMTTTASTPSSGMSQNTIGCINISRIWSTAADGITIRIKNTNRDNPQQEFNFDK